MDERKIRIRLNHMLEAIAAIRSYVAGKDFDEYRSDRILHDAVERNLERLSEAARYIRDELRAKHSEIPWRQIAGLGNVLRHAYEGVDNQTIWETVEFGLPPLKIAVESLVRDLESGTCLRHWLITCSVVPVRDDHVETITRGSLRASQASSDR